MASVPDFERDFNDIWDDVTLELQAIIEEYRDGCTTINECRQLMIAALHKHYIKDFDVLDISEMT